MEVRAFDIVLRHDGKPVQKQDEIPDHLEIPESLKPLQGDSLDVRDRKKKQIKRLKSDLRKRKLENEGVRRQNNWQSFMTGGKRTINSKKPKSSIFATSEEGRVGVVGSGKPMTNYRETGRGPFDLADDWD